jgi:dTDP-4-amino-4,6-dideoxygalactose transaminase
MKINFVDLAAQYKNLNLDELNNLIKMGRFVGGEHLNNFERNLAKYVGVNFAIGVGSGTDALWLSLLALGVGRGDEVLVPANTFIATAFAISQTGATPIFVDVHHLTYNIDIASSARASTKKTKAIIPVHLYGNPCDMEAIMGFAKLRNLLVIEDCAQAIGATFNEKRVGSFGNMAALSFYPTKNLGGLGQGGVVLTNNEELAETVRELGNVGRRRNSWYDYDYLGFNSRLDNLNAWFLNEGLKDLEANNRRRNEIAIRYNNKLKTCLFVETPKIAPKSESVYHLYEIRVRDRWFRDALKNYLNDCGVSTGLHYPIPCHKQSVYKDFRNIDLSVSESLADTLLSLPMHPNLTEVEIDYVCDCINSFKFKEQKLQEVKHE